MFAFASLSGLEPTKWQKTAFFQPGAKACRCQSVPLQAKGGSP